MPRYCYFFKNSRCDYNEQTSWNIECSTLTASSFKIWNSSTGISPPPLALFIVMLLEGLLDFTFQDVWLWLSDHTIMVIWVIKTFFVQCFYVFFLISSVSVRSIQFLSFIVPFFAWNVPLVSLIFLKRSVVFPILLFFLFLCIAPLRRLSYLSLFFFGTQHSDGHIFPFLLCVSLLFFSQVFVRPPQTAVLPVAFLFPGVVLITASYTMLWASVHSSSGSLSVRANPLNLFVTSTV